MTSETQQILHHILDARIDHAIGTDTYVVWKSARDIVEYALADNIECLRQFDYLDTLDEMKFI